MKISHLILMGYRPPQYRRGLKLQFLTFLHLSNDIDHPNIEGGLKFLMLLFTKMINIVVKNSDKNKSLENVINIKSGT